MYIHISICQMNITEFVLTFRYCFLFTVRTSYEFDTQLFLGFCVVLSLVVLHEITGNMDSIPENTVKLLIFFQLKDL